MKTKPFLFVAFLSGICVQGNAQSADDNDVIFKVLASGNFSQIIDQTIVVVREDAAWQRLWEEHAGASRDMPMPAVDFNTEMVVAHFLGQTPSCAYNVAVTGIEDHVNFVAVKSQVSIPTDIIVCLVAEQPFEIVKLPRHDKPIIIKQRADMRKAVTGL